MARDHTLHVVGRDVLPSTPDVVARAAQELEAAVLVPATAVAGPPTIVATRGGSLLGPVEVARRKQADAAVANDDLSDLTRRQRLSIRGDDRNVEVGEGPANPMHRAQSVHS